MGAAAKAMQALGGGQDGERPADIKLRDIIKEEIDVGVDRKTAYNQWTQFEEFQSIFKGVTSTSQEARSASGMDGEGRSVDSALESGDY